MCVESRNANMRVTICLLAEKRDALTLARKRKTKKSQLHESLFVVYDSGLPKTSMETVTFSGVSWRKSLAIAFRHRQIGTVGSSFIFCCEGPRCI